MEVIPPGFVTSLVVLLRPTEPDSGGVYVGRLAPARVSHRDDFVISYRVYSMTGSFHTMFTLKLIQNRKHG